MEKPEHEKKEPRPVVKQLKGLPWKVILSVLTVVILLVWVPINLEPLGVFLHKLGQIFEPFLLGCVLAFLLNVLMRPLETLWTRLWRKAKTKLPAKLKRPVCLALSAVILFGILFAVAFMVVPGLKDSVSSLVTGIPAYAAKVGTWWTGVTEEAALHGITLPNYAVDTDALTAKLTEFISDKGTGLLNITVDATAGILSAVVNGILAIVFALYILVGKERIAARLKELVLKTLPEEKAHRVLEIADLSNRTFLSFVSGQLIEAVILGTLCFIGMLILRMPYPAVISVLIAFTALIPILGAWIGGGISAFLILLTDPMKALWFAIFLLVLQQLEGNLIYPKVVGKSVGLPGILVLIAVTVGGSAFGLWGMLLSVPVTAVLYRLYQEYIAAKDLPEGETPQ